ncbi:hypothetical protein [Kamptonema sp. UHCC 0994]|uniref:hypothetical protein n=1 Tax=Kamptonema sp. UHCC 0994 TaxID=3031329 RepID=UPI0023B9E85A|nr:hypothetical protein [Kamptonema sp. UHCC 0994]MDF0553883.1 hypothetical protein [Kamptonema sp. UHCC 0994]
MNRNPRRRAGNMQHGTYAPPTPEQNIRSFERFPVSRENIVVNYKFYGRLGYGEESKFSLENSINEFKRIAQLNKENPFKWIPGQGLGSGNANPPPRGPLIETLEGFPIHLFSGSDISFLNQTIEESILHFL